MNKISFIFIISLLVIILSATITAATITSNAVTGNWSATTSWVGGIIPAATDIVVIATGANISTAGNQTCAGITITGTLSMAAGNVLTVNGNVSGAGTWTAANATRNISLTGNWSLNAAATSSGTATFTGTNAQTLTGRLSSVNNTATLVINKTGGSVTLGNALNVAAFTNTAGTFDPSTYLLTAGTRTFTAGTLRVGGATWAGNYSGAITQPAAGTIEYYANTVQTVNNIAYPGNLTLSGSGTKTLTMTAARTITGNLTVNTGANFTTAGNFAFTVAGTTSITGTLTLGGTTGKTFTGNVTINSGGVWNETGASIYSFAGNLQNNGTTFTANTGTHTFSGATKTISGASTISIPTVTFTGANTNSGTLTVPTLLTVTGVTLLNNSTITATTALSGTGGVTNGSTGVLNIGAASAITTLTATAAGNTVNYTGAVQTVKPTTYVNLSLSGSGLKTTATITVNGILTLGGTTTVSAVPTYGGSSSLVYAGSASQTTGIELPTTMAQAVAINNNNGVTLNRATTINGTLTFTAGNLTLGANALTLGGSVSGAAANKCVVTNGTGAVSRSIAASGNFSFPIAAVSGNYNPVSITNNSGGSVVYTALIKAISPAAPNPANGLNYMWTLTAGSAVSSSLSFSWLNTNAGSGLSANPGNGSAWTYGTKWVEMGGFTTAGTPNVTSNVSTSAPAGNWTIGLTGALPVQMTSFTATLQGTSALLNWATATETNNTGFQIERSIEGSNVWAEVAFINGAGTSSSQKIYSYEDKNLAPGMYVYRIKQIDNDGTTTIYNPNALPKVDAGISTTFQLGGNYPNPFNPSTNLQFSVPQDGYASLKVYNMLGQEVATLFSGMARAGHYIPATFNASRLASGIYFARLQYNGKSLVQRMLMTK
jgi:Secretion system C-terminal sorting domain